MNAYFFNLHYISKKCTGSKPKGGLKVRGGDNPCTTNGDSGSVA